MVLFGRRLGHFLLQERVLLEKSDRILALFYIKSAN